LLIDVAYGLPEAGVAREETSMNGVSSVSPRALHPITGSQHRELRVPYALRRVPLASFASVLPLGRAPDAGDIALARVEKIGKNARLELTDGRPCSLHEGDLASVVFGNRYATAQFEGYASRDGDACDLLSMGGLCGLVRSKHASVAGPTKLRLLGMLGDAAGRPLMLGNFALPRRAPPFQPSVVVVCGSSMDAGKTHTVVSLIRGLRRDISHVASVKLTGTAAGRDTWAMLDAGSCAALDFVDAGFASTYLCTLQQLLGAFDLLITHAALAGAEWVVLEIADGLLQGETAALIQHAPFARNVDAWVLAASAPMAAESGVRMLRGWGIEPLVVSGLVSMSPLGCRETEAATGVACLTAQALRAGELNRKLLSEPRPPLVAAVAVS
jgi:hypothetical protein